MYTCAITGDQPTAFKFKYNEKDSRCKRLKRRLQEQFALLYDQGVRRFLVGGALGVDQWSGEILLKMKLEPDYKDIELIVVLPYPGHDERWDQRSRARLGFLMQHSTDRIIIGTKAWRESFIQRDRYLIDHANYLLAVHNNKQHFHNGAGEMIRYAQSRHLMTILIHPETFEISHV